MHWLYFFVRFFPYIALPLVLVFFELGVHFKRRNRRGWQALCWGGSVMLIALMGTWFAFRGDIHSDTWVRDTVSLGQ
jgi:drug/metabolite transporter (DMT)-like permease